MNQRTLLLFVALHIATTFMGCLKTQPLEPNKQATDRLATINRNGEMRVGYLTFDPCVIRDPETGQLSGVFVDMVDQIAQATKVKVVWVETNLANFAAGLNSNKFDFCVGPTFITPQRSMSVRFSQPINYLGNSGIIRKSASFTLTKAEDLNRSDLRIAVLQGQVMEDYCRKFFPKAELVVMPGSDLTLPFAAVSSGRADIGLMNNVVARRYADRHNDVKVILEANEQLEVLPMAWTTRMEDDRLMHFLNSSITYLRSTGRIAEFHKRYQTPLAYEEFHLRIDE